MSRQQMVVCGTPDKDCTGTVVQGTKGMRPTKAHATPEDAYRCYANSLKKNGYQERPNREFYKPGEPIIVLTKKSRFGAVLRSGKEGRFMPKKRHSGWIT